MKKIALGLLFLIFGSGLSFAQTHLAVSINHPVYLLISSAEVKGLATKLSQVKPYTRRQIQEILAQISAKSYALSNTEREILAYYIDEFSSDFDDEAGVTSSFLRGRADFAAWKSTASLGIGLDMHFQVAAEKGKDYYLRMPIKFYARGDIYDSLVSYRMDAQLSFDRLRKFPFVHPGYWQQSGMGFHQSLSSDNSGDATSGGLAFGYEMRPEVAMSLWQNRILMRYGIVEGHDTGNGTAGLVFSRYGVPMQAFEINARVLPFVNIYSMVGSLGNDKTDFQNTGSGDKSDPSQLALQHNKMVSYHMGEFFIGDYFYLNLWESVIWGKRFEIGYLNPLGIYMIQQNLSGDLDNMALGLSGATIAPRFFKFWAETYLDELVLKLDSPRAEFANQLGLRFNVPWVPFTTLTAQYTKLEPYVYTHYPQDYNFNGTNSKGQDFFTDTGFTNQGKALGNYLKPNSDEFLIRIDTMPKPGLHAYLGWQLIRHGSNPKVKVYMTKNGRIGLYDPANPPSEFWDLDGDGAFSEAGDTFWGWDPTKINGELDAPLRYGNAAGMKKNFLNDGIYDWTNIVSAGVSYDLRALKIKRDKGKFSPIIVSFDYQFSYTFYDMNGIKLDATKRAPEYANNYKPYFKNIFVLKLTVFPNY